MKRPLWTAETVVVFLLAVPTLAQNAANPIQVALLRWYQANTATQLSTCSEPTGLAFDGTHIWVACGNGATNPNTLQEFNASDGTQLSLNNGNPPVVGNPWGLVYDGANIWASNQDANTVTEVNAASGQVVGSPIAVGSDPRNLAFDGTNIWVANYGSGSITEINASTRTVVNTIIYSSATCEHPWGIIFDGTYIWVACYYNNAVLAIPVSNPTSYTSITVGSFPTFLAYDGEVGQIQAGIGQGPFIWVSNFSSGSVTMISESTMAVVDTIHLPTGSGPYGIAFDGEYIWVADGASNSVSKFYQNQTVSTAVSTYQPSSPLVLSLPGFVAFDGGNIWVASKTGGTITKF